MSNQVQSLSIKVLGIANILISLLMGLPMILVAFFSLTVAFNPEPLKHGNTTGGTTGAVPYLGDAVDRAFGLVAGGLLLLVAGLVLAVGLAIGIGLLRQQNWARVLGIIQGVCNVLVALGCLLLGLLIARDELVAGLVVGIVSSAPFGIFGAATLTILGKNPWKAPSTPAIPAS